uniref:CTLH domain-containing protein n=1 Tax=Glossina brevipalpis TaxID=37001 RepID=A0A1A9X4J6_9MUSC
MATSSSSSVKLNAISVMENENELDGVVNEFTEIDDIALLQALSKLDQKVNDDSLNTGSELDTNTENAMGDEIEMDPSCLCVGESQVAVITNTLQIANKKLQHLSVDYNDLYDCFSQAGEVIDYEFILDFTIAMWSDAVQDVRKMMLLNKVNAKHYCRQAIYVVSQLLVERSKTSIDMVRKVFDSQSRIAEIYRIWKAMQQHNLGPALKWSARYSNELKAKKSSLEFELHRLAFLQIILRGMPAQQEAILYARNNFYKFVNNFEKDIPKLMGCFIYLHVGIENSPYKHLISAEMWTEISYVFLKDACHTLGIRKNPHLSVIINAGCIALTALLTVEKITRKVCMYKQIKYDYCFCRQCYLEKFAIFSAIATEYRSGWGICLTDIEAADQ